MPFLVRRRPTRRARIPRPRGRRERLLWLAVLLLLVVAYRLLPEGSLRPAGDPPPFPYDEQRTWRVERVVDGDTLLLEQRHRVRLIGVDTPETVHPTLPVEPFGPEAAEFTRRHVEGRQVTLRFDRERRDRFGRILAYVYVDDWFLNEELIRAGYGEAATGFPFSAAMKRRFEQAEEEARAAGRGIWSLTPAGLPE